MLPFPGPGASTDPRPASVLVGGTVTFGVPRAGRPVAAFGSVTTIRWVSATELLAVFNGGIVRWTQAGTQWTAKAWALTARDVLIERTQTITDVAPVTGTHDFYVTTVGAPGADVETVWFYEGAADQFHRTAFRHVLDTGPLPAGLGPTDPAYAVVVDPVSPDHVYVGTASGVWVGVRQDLHGTHHWDPFAEGLPEAAVQDLGIWQGPVGTPQLLRAAVQSLGLWETDLSNAPVRSTYVRVHAHDSRRLASTPLPDPRQPPVPVANLPVHSSPDVVVRPRSSPLRPLRSSARRPTPRSTRRRSSCGRSRPPSASSSRRSSRRGCGRTPSPTWWSCTASGRTFCPPGSSSTSRCGRTWSSRPG